MTRELDILNCAASGQVEFRFVCPSDWHQMQATDSPTRRFCLTCQRAVFKCHDTNEAALRAEQGECIAVPMWLARDARREEHPGQVIIAGQPRTIREVLTESANRRAADLQSERHKDN